MSEHDTSPGASPPGGEAPDVQMFTSGPLIVTRVHCDTMHRTLNGMLERPPTVWVMIDDAELGQVRFEQISWAVAKALCPRDIDTVAGQMADVRDREHKIIELQRELGEAEFAAAAEAVARDRRGKA